MKKTTHPRKRAALSGASTMVAVAVIACATPATAHDCAKPSAPFVTDRATLSFDQANAMTDAIDTYIAATNVYLACLERADADARAEVEQVIRTWEAPVQDLQIVQ